MAGNVEQRGRNRWRLTVSLGKDHNGKYIRKRRTVTAKNKTEAKQLLTIFENEILSDEYIEPAKITFGSFVSDWKKLHAKKHLSPRTYETYNYILSTHILPAFNSKKIDNIKPIHISEYLDTLETNRKDGKEGGLSSATIYKHYAILRSIFNYATNELRILKHNPVASVKKPKVKNQKFNIYSDKEVEELFKLLDKELIHYRLITKIALLGGLRRGEVLGLLWKNVNYSENTIYVQYSLNYTKEGGYVLKSPKNEETRVVTLPQFLMKEIKDYQQLLEDEKKEIEDVWNPLFSDLIFTTQGTTRSGTIVFGKPFYPGSITRWWNRFINRSDIKKIRFHDLRHTAATLLINEGLHAKHISERLGHGDIKITMNTYGHYLKEADERAANILENKFGNRKV